MPSNTIRSVVALALLALPVRVLAGISYDESVSGDFSADRLNPSALVLGAGSNFIAGTFGATTPTSDAIDLDYVTVTVPAGLKLDAFVVTSANVGGGFSFVGVEAGPQVSVPYTTASAASLLGWSHFGTTSVGADLLPEMRIAPGAQGFAGPMGPGQYTLWIMELNTTQVFNYGFDLQTSAVPEPAAVSMLALGCAALARRRARD